MVDLFFLVCCDGFHSLRRRFMRSSPGAGHVCISLKVDLCSHNVTWFVVMWSLMKSSVLVCDHHYIFHVCEWERAFNFFPVCFSQRHGWPFCLQTPVFTCFQSQPTSKFSVYLIPLLSDTHHLCHLTPSRLHLIMQACIFPLIYCACNRKYGEMPLLRLFFFFLIAAYLLERYSSCTCRKFTWRML